MTNTERNKNNLQMLIQKYANTPSLSVYNDLTISLLTDISISLASIADSLESLPPREENVRIGTNV